ncbi:helix-turn-helix transcriptional regulator [Pseudonocardia sp. GCM10023141]|uniref:helix-turn-helix transcriptional regulator n=1 Tax=Pseudonocardia sp. GCM10023141 TaxID=3252653 RepID=UPI00361ACEFF
MARLGVGIGLVGRRQELSAFTGALDRARAARPTGVLLAGDAGVGKSRLIAEAVDRAVAGGFTVLVGRCLDSAESLPYLPFTEIVGSLAVTHPELINEHAALRHLLPGGWNRGDASSDDRALGQLRVFDAVLSALDALCAEGPVLLVVEDLHWADRSSRDLLVFLLSRLTAQRLVVLTSYRTDDLHRRHPLRPVLSELVRLPAVERLDLSPLDGPHALDLVRQLADGSLSEQLLRRVAKRSEGNAFFAEELVSASSDRLPHGLAEVLMARVEALTPATQQVLRIASVAGRRVRHDRLAAVSGLPDDELEMALREAVTHHVLVTAPARPGVAGDAYLFRHALLREAIYHELLPGERSRIHAAYAWLLAEGPDEQGVAAELAHHALAGHDLPRALAASVAAAREADRREAPAEMLLHTEQALELWNAVPEAATVAAIDEVMLTRWAAWAASATGDYDRGIALSRRAVELAEQRNDPVLSSSIKRRYAMRLLELSGREHEALDVAIGARTLIEGTDNTASHAWACAIVARALCRLERWQEAADEARCALDIAAAEDDKMSVSARADALISLAVCEERAGEPGEARTRWVEAKRLARRGNNIGVELRAYYNLGMSLLDEGRLPEASEVFGDGEARAAESGITWSIYGLDLRVAHVIARFMRGDWDASEEAAEPAGESVSVEVASRLTAAGLLTTVGRGRLAAASKRVAELADSHPVDEQVILLLGQAAAEVALWQHHWADAARAVDESIAGINAVYPFQIGSIMLAALGIAAQAELAAAGTVALATAAAAGRAYLELAEETAERGVPRAGRIGPEGRAWLCRARAELTRITGPKPEMWGEVCAAFGYEIGLLSTGAPEQAPEVVGYRQAYARLRRAEALLVEGGLHAAVADDLRAAAATAEQLRAAPLAAAVQAMADRAGVRLDGTVAPRTTAADPLTPREHSVLEKVAGGLTNRQVGAELFISEKTVSVHLSRVMAKLGASSRTEAVTVAYARGLLAPTDHELARSDP